MNHEPTLIDRLRTRCAENVVPVLAILLVLAAVGGWLVYTTHVAPPTEIQDREVGAIEADAGYEYSATVERENEVFPVGTELDDRDRFFTSVTPELDGRYVYSFESTTAESVAAETELVLRLRATDGDTEYWSDREVLGRERVEATDGSGTVQVPFAVDVPAAQQRIAAIEDDLGSAGSTEIGVVARTTVVGTVAGETVEETHTHVLAIQPQGPTFGVSPEVDTTRIAVTESTTAPTEFGPLRTYGSVVLFVLSTGLLAVVGGLHHRGALAPPAEVREAIQRERTRDALDEWITVGRVPPGYGRNSVIAVESLAGLVDVAIDSDRRVIEDDERDRYFVVLDDWVYIYPPDEHEYDPAADVTPPAENEAASEGIRDPPGGLEANTVERPENPND